MKRIIHVQAFHKPLMDAGLVPKNCRLMEIAIGTTDHGGILVRYEVFFDADDLLKFGRICEELAVDALDAATRAELDAQRRKE